jgi:hypothetical protein
VSPFKERRHVSSRFASIAKSCGINTYKILVCKSSKMNTYKKRVRNPFRMNTCGAKDLKSLCFQHLQKTGGRGVIIVD